MPLTLKKVASAAFAAASLTVLTAQAAGQKLPPRNYIEIRYDVDLKTGICTRSSQYMQGEEAPIVLPVPCDEYAFEFISAEKKPEYIRKFGPPKKNAP